jgi:hypothetical protein
MINGYIASIVARMEYEELVRSMAPVRDYDEWRTYEAGNWQTPRMTTLLTALKTGLLGLAARFPRKPEPEVEVLPSIQEADSVIG